MRYIYNVLYITVIYGPRLRRIRRVSRIRTQNISPQPHQNISSNFMAELGAVLKKLTEAIEKQMVPQAAHQEQMLKHLEALSLQQKKTNEWLKGISGRLSIMEMRMMRTVNTYAEHECSRQISNLIKEADAAQDDQFLLRQIVGEAHAMQLSRQYSPGPNLSKDQWTWILEIGIRLASDDVRMKLPIWGISDG